MLTFGRPRRLGKIELQTMLLGVLPLAFLVALLLLSLAIQSRNMRVADASQHAAQIITESDRQQRVLAEASRAVVIYARTHGKSSLQLLRAAQHDLPASSRALAAMVADDPLQHARASHLVRAYAMGLNILDRYVRDVDAHDVRAQHQLEQSPAVRSFNAQFAPVAAALARGERIALTHRLLRLQAQVRTFTYILVALCVLAIISTLLMLLRFGVRITQRLRHLAENSIRLARGESTVPLGGEDEIAQLDVIYQEMTRRIHAAHDRAALLQRALLPQTIPAFPGLRLDASYVSAGSEKSIGGDWYDVFRISEQLIGISVGDVAGHGLGAAALMASARHAIRTLAFVNDEPSAVMRQVNRILCRDTEAGLVTAIFATFNLYDGNLRYCLAGHPPPMLARAGETLRELPGRGFVLGVDPRSTFETHAEQLEIGSALVLYTDGLTESQRSATESAALLREAVEDEYRNGAGNIAHAIERRMFAGTEPRDDCAVLFLGVTALGEDAMQSESASWLLDARAEESARRVTRAVLWHLGEIAEDGTDLSLSELILAEMIGNVARHTPGPAEVLLKWMGDTATLRICDRGPRFEAPDETGAGDLLAESGRGIFLMRSLARAFSVQWMGDGNCVTAVLPLRIAPPALARITNAV